LDVSLSRAARSDRTLSISPKSWASLAVMK
jgi:hypothetical protein